MPLYTNLSLAGGDPGEAALGVVVLDDLPVGSLRRRLKHRKE